VGYDTRTRRLEVEFHNGRIYRHSKVPVKLWNQFQGAKSLGAFYNYNLKGNFDPIEITPPQEVPVYDQLKRSTDT
jgi:hypothetical protein